MIRFGRGSGFAIKASVIAVLLAVVSVSFWYVVQAVSLWKHADMAYRANAFATEAVELYVRERGKWPASWMDLESVYATGGTRILPQGGWNEIRPYVEINFDLTLADVANQQTDDFDAIRPREPVWGDYRRYYTSLLESVRTLERSKCEQEEEGVGEEKGDSHQIQGK